MVGLAPEPTQLTGQTFCPSVAPHTCVRHRLDTRAGHVSEPPTHTPKQKGCCAGARSDPWSPAAATRKGQQTPFLTCSEDRGRGHAGRQDGSQAGGGFRSATRGPGRVEVREGRPQAEWRWERVTQDAWVPWGEHRAPGGA